MEETMKIKTLLLLFILLPVFCFAGGRNQSSNAASSGMRPLRIGYQWHNHGLPVYIAIEEGMFVEAGLNVSTLIFGSGPPLNEALGAGQLDVVVTGPVPAIGSGVAYNTKLIGVSADDTMSISYWARPDSDIARISGRSGTPGILGDANSWRGKSILCPVSTNVHFMLVAVLKKMGLGLDDVRIIPMDVAPAYTAFRAGQGDVVSLFAPQSIFAEDEGYVKVASGMESGEIIYMVIIASEDAMKNKKEELTDFLRIYYTASEKYANNMQKYIEYMLKFQIENGLQVDERLVTITCNEKPMPTFDDQRRLWAGTYGQRGVDTMVFNVMDYFIGQGQYTQADKQKLINNTFIDGELINRIIR